MIQVRPTQWNRPSSISAKTSRTMAKMAKTSRAIAKMEEVELAPSSLGNRLSTPT
jgi:hypothetical protein